LIIFTLSSFTIFPFPSSPAGTNTNRVLPQPVAFPLNLP
jgi:hypothetical protein